MKSLLQYISEAKEGFTRVSTEWMIENYDRFNEIYFNNELPNSSDIDIQYTYNKIINGSLLGCQGFHKNGTFYRDRTRNDMYIIYKDGKELTSILDIEPFIYLNSKVPMSIDKFEDTLIHEMVHLYNSKDCLWPKQAHGKEFKKKCDEIRKIAKERDGKDYELTTYAKKENHNYDATEMVKSQLAQKSNLKNIVGMFIEFDTDKLKDPNQKQIYTFCTRNISKKFIDYVMNDYGECNPTIYITSDSYEKICLYCGQMFRTFTTFRYWILANFKEENNEKQFIYETMTNTKEIITKNNESLKIDESYWNERPRKLTKKDLENLVYVIPADTNLSDFDAETDAIPSNEPEEMELDELFN